MPIATRSQTIESKTVEEEYNLTKEIRNEAVKKPPRLPKRYVVMFLLFLGMVNVFILRVNLNIAIVDMTSNKTIIFQNQTIVQKPEFDWNSKTKGIVLSLFYYGYLVIMPIGGYFATKFGGVSTFGVGIFVTAIFTILSPINFYLNFYWFAICRIIEGSFEALCYTSTADICSRWTKPDERSKIVSLVFSATYIGVFVAFPLCGYIARKYGWPAIFYVTGSLSLLWFCFWIMLATNDPSPDDTDRKFLARIWGSRPNQKPYPWKNLLTSRPLWILSMAKFSYGWGLNLLVQCFPLFIKDVTGAEIDKVGYLSAVPTSAAIFSVPFSGYLIDIMINKKILTPTYAHKLITCVSSLVSATLLMSTTFITDFITIFIIFVLYQVTLSFMFVVEQVMPLYLSPEYASGICGISSFGYTMGNILSPTVYGFVVTNHSVTQWNRHFTITAALLATNSVLFGLFSSSELQPWSEEIRRPQGQQFQRINQ